MLKIISTTFALLILPVAALAQEELVIPTEMCRDYFFVPIVVSAQEGRPASDADRTLWLIYDTGAERTYIDPDSIARVANMDVSDLDGVNITNATMGPLDINRLPVRLSQLDHLTVGLGREIDGILGYTFFRDFLMTLDYEAGTIRLTEGELPRPDNETVFSTRGPGVRPFLRVDIDGRTRRLLIDSGAGGTPLAVQNLDRYNLTETPRPVGASIRFSRIEYRDGGRLAGNARIGPHVFEQPLIESLPETEIIGGMMMRHFTWTFDLENDRVRIERIDSGGPITMDAEVTHGLALRPTPGRTITIDAILPGSAAAGAGLAEGDVLTHFDGLPVAERGCGVARGEPMPDAITVRRQGENTDISLPLVTLVD
ncbi:hypothetical protein [Hyphobacterium indicum]|uniref:hypothetical protein n=1 Tax=Hyphobacterium indicum TaxID=2162714 RepID=UPI000D6420AF|nr:hypothetical protein [Hyphobacterium indicum]